MGIPLTIAALLLAAWQLYEWRWDLWYRPLVLLLAGYLLQFIGHVHEGNDMGEVVLIKRLLGRPYTAVSPRYARDQNPKRERGPGSENAVDQNPKRERRADDTGEQATSTTRAPNPSPTRKRGSP